QALERWGRERGCALLRRIVRQVRLGTCQVGAEHRIKNPSPWPSPSRGEGISLASAFEEALGLFEVFLEVRHERRPAGSHTRRIAGAPLMLLVDTAVGVV